MVVEWCSFLLAETPNWRAWNERASRSCHWAPNGAIDPDDPKNACKHHILHGKKATFSWFLDSKNDLYTWEFFGMLPLRKKRNTDDALWTLQHPDFAARLEPHVLLWNQAKPVWCHGFTTGGPWRDLGRTLDLFSGKGCLNPKRKQQIPPSLGDWLNF